MIITKITKVYILAPAKESTGGPEALHQLGYNIKKYTNKKKVFMQYVPVSNKSSINPNYKKYNLNFSKEVEDKKENLLIVPEQYSYIKLSQKYKKIRKAIWWLSYDHYVHTLFQKINSPLIKLLIKIPFKIIELFNKLTQYYFGNYTFLDYLRFIYNDIKIFNKMKFENINFHFFQSIYAKNILQKNKIKSFPLFDYLNEDFLKKNNSQRVKKKNYICYNSAKSTKFMKKIIADNSNLNFFPLINLTKKEMITKLKKSKIYMDFGTHPGKDRMPREAAILGNCVITNKKGSANNKYDIQIPNEFKFEEKHKNINKIIKTINRIFQNHKKEQKKFKSYIKKIKLEKKVFKKQITNIF